MTFADHSIPEKVEVWYPSYDCGEDLVQGHYAVTITSAEATGNTVHGFEGKAILHSSMLAIIPPTGGDPSNAFALGDSASQIATDYYAWAIPKFDLMYHGVLAWQPNGLNDEFEIAYGLDEIYTHAWSQPVLQVVDDFLQTDCQECRYHRSLTTEVSCVGGKLKVYTSDVSYARQPDTGNSIVTYVADQVYSHDAGCCDCPTGYGKIRVRSLDACSRGPRSGYTVTLKDTSGLVIATGSTDINGYCIFGSALPGLPTSANPYTVIVAGNTTGGTGPNDTMTTGGLIVINGVQLEVPVQHTAAASAAVINFSVNNTSCSPKKLPGATVTLTGGTGTDGTYSSTGVSDSAGNVTLAPIPREYRYRGNGTSGGYGSFNWVCTHPDFQPSGTGIILLYCSQGAGTVVNSVTSPGLKYYDKFYGGDPLVGTKCYNRPFPGSVTLNATVTGVYSAASGTFVLPFDHVNGGDTGVWISSCQTAASFYFRWTVDCRGYCDAPISLGGAYLDVYPKPGSGPCAVPGGSTVIVASLSGNTCVDSISMASDSSSLPNSFTVSP